MMPVRMRLTRTCARYIIVCLVVNLVILLWLGFWQHRQITSSAQSRQPVHVTESYHSSTHKPPAKPFLTIIFQDFDAFDTSIGKLVDDIARKMSDVTILVVSENVPYPPIALPKLNNVHLVLLSTRLNQVLNATRPDSFIHSEYVLFLPDRVSVTPSIVESLQDFRRGRDHVNEAQVLALAVRGSKLRCHGLVLTKKDWTLELGRPLKDKTRCGYVSGDHGILMRSEYVGLLPNPFLRPTFMSLYVQLPTDMKASIVPDFYLPDVQSEDSDPYKRWQHKQEAKERLRNLYSVFGIKRVVHANGKTDWYGCTKESGRCFGTIYNAMPDYLYEGRWTPPCCLKALRETVKHVFSILDSCKVRYWLEGGSLLGAARNKDIIPWDYDIDLGIYSEDILKCNQLVKLKQAPFVDEDGYSWEKADPAEGDFLRVQYSETNHLHVDLFPFFSRNGTMTKNTWFKTHKQDTEFPEHYLKPLTRIQFAGLNASAPNHIKSFLEYKFGKGVIENPRYPNAQLPT